ncbi:MAG TPA: Ig-like domain-containing protein [Bryobacteraceae bacterium]|nr:Ig-like domain-containing protein [Bryobacteraceae bacterium]
MRLRILLLIALLCLTAGLSFGQSGFTLSLTTNPNPSNFGQPVQMSAGPAVSGGVITFYDGGPNGTPLGSGSATGNSTTVTITVSSLSVGAHQIQACENFPGSEQLPSTNCAVASNTVTQQVLPIPTSLQVSSSTNPSSPCQPVTFTATINPASATGTVTFFDGTATLGSAQISNGSASITVPSLTTGTHQIQARFTSTTGFAGSSAQLAQVVSGAAAATLTSSLNPSSFSQNVTFSVNVASSPCAGVPSGPTPTGTVSFFDGTTLLGQATLSGGNASFSISTLSVGNHSIDAHYNGDANYAGVDSNIVTQVVNPGGKTNTTTTLTASATSITTTQSVTLTATVSPAAATGQVQFKDGSTVVGTGTLSGGTASFTASNLTAGTHTFTAVYLGDNNNNTSTSNPVTVTVTTNTTTTLTASAASISTTQSVTLTATVAPSGATGQVQFKDGSTVVGSGTLNSSGVASFTASNLTAGQHTFTAVYQGDSNFNSSTSNPVTVTVTSTPNNTTTTLTASATSITTTQSVTLTATVSPNSATGQVQFKDGGTVVGTGTLTSGVTSFTASNLTAGQHTFTATYLGDSNDNASTSNPVTVTVTSTPNNTTTTLTASATTISTSQSLTLTATVSPNTATGQVQFKDGGTVVGTAAMIGGVSNLTLSNIPAGTHTYTATYLGDANDNSSTSNAVTVTVTAPAKTNSTTALTASLPNPVPSGQPLTLTATVTPSTATGIVQFFDNGNNLGSVTLVNGVASITTSTLASGNHIITAAYAGDANFNASSATLTVTIGTAPTNTTTSLSASSASVSTTQSLTLTAAVSPFTATGQVQFRDGGTIIGTATLNVGTASITLSNLAAGSHTFTATYLGSSSFNSSTSNPVTVTVTTPNGPPNTPGTTVTLASAPNPSTFGQTVVFQAFVSAVSNTSTPTGTITFNDGSTNLGTVTLTNGSASLSISTLTVGSHTVVATYSGDANFGSATSNGVIQVVNKAPTTTSLNASPTTVNPGQSVQLTAKVAPVTATGTVTFSDGGTTIATVAVAAGSASTSATLTGSGTHSITAAYSGDANFLASSSSATVTVSNTTATTTSLSASPTTISVGQSVTLSASVSPAGATGSVTFSDGGSGLGSATLTNGSASISVSSLAVGTHSITATYSGDSKFAGSSSSAVTVTVTGKANSTTSLSASPNAVASGSPVTLSASVSPATATGTVTFLDGGASVGSATLSGGNASVSVSLSTGSHTVTASYSGDANTNASTSNAVTVTVNSGPTLGAISPTALTQGVVGAPYSQTFSVTGGTTPLTWTLASGSVPGLTLSSAGVLSGTPTTAGTTSLTIRVQDSANPALATAAVLSLTILGPPSVSISAPSTALTTDQPIPSASLGAPFALPLVGTFSLSFSPNAANLPANYTNPDVKFVGGSTVTGNINFPPNSTAAQLLPAVQVGSVAGTITVKLQTLTANGVSVLPTTQVVATITIARSAPVIVPGSVKITNITSTGFTVVLDGSSNTRDLTSATLTFTAASGATLNGASETVSLTTPANTWFSDAGAGRGVANGGAFSLSIPFNYSGDPNAIGTVSVTLTNSAGTSAAVSGGK